MPHTLPWYRQFWPWFIFGLPAVVVVAALITVWIAFEHADDLVDDNYYREGLAINRELSKQELANTLGIEAEMEASVGLVRVRLQGRSIPSALQLQLSHPADADLDISLPLAQVAPGVFEARWESGATQRWYWHLEPLGVSETQRWRVDGVLSIIALDE